MKTRKPTAFAAALAGALACHAAENVPQRPFGQAAVMPSTGQWVATPWYEYTEFFHYFQGGRKVNLEANPGQDSHGFDQNDGFVQVEYGFRDRWAADVTVGYTSAATRSFSPTTEIVRKTSGRSDSAFGLRYQLAREDTAHRCGMPTVVFRAGGIYTGGYDKDFPFAPGNGSVGIEPSLVATKHFGWEGFGGYAHVGYRYFRSGGHDQWFSALGLQQEVGSWTLNLGYRHVANTGGVDIGGTLPNIVYSRQVREVADQLEGGFAYRDRGGRSYQFFLRKTVDGNNTSSALVFGVFASFPFGGK